MKQKIRFTNDQKTGAIDEIKTTMLNYAVEMKITEGKNRNVYSKGINDADIIFMAHYDTPLSTNEKAYLIKTISRFWAALIAVAWICMAKFLYIIGNSIVKEWLKHGKRMAVSLFIASILTTIIFIIGFIILVFVSTKVALLFPRKINVNNYNDNTSGIIGIFKIAEALVGTENKNVGFIFFDNEEKGLKGSKSFVSENKLNASLIVNLDCIATKNAIDGIHVFRKKDKISSNIIDSALSIYENSTSNKVQIHTYKRIFSKLKLININSIFNGYLGGSDFMNFKNYNVLSVTRCDIKFLSGYYIPFVHSSKDTEANSSPDEIIRIANTMVEIVKDFNLKKS